MPVKTILTAGIILLLSHTGFCQQDSVPMREVKDIEYKRFAAQVAKDTIILGSVLSPDLIYTHSNGKVDTKQSFIQAIAEGKLVYQKIDVEEMQLRGYNDGRTMVSNGKAMVTMPPADGKPLLLHLRYVAVYIKQPGGWQMVLWQSTRLPE